MWATDYLLLPYKIKLKFITALRTYIIFGALNECIIAR